MESSSEIKFTKSERGRVVAILDSKMYHLNKENKETFNCYFLCTERLAQNCKGRVTVYNFNKKTLSFDSFKATKEHRDVCAPCPEKVIKKRAYGLAKEIVASNVNIKTGKIVEMVENKVIEDPDEAVGLGKISQFKRMIRRAKQQAKGEQHIGSSRVDFVLPKHLLSTTRGDRFLLEDFHGSDRQLTFASDGMIKILADCNVWLVDGTFKLAPNWFSQVFTIHGLYMGTCIPVAYSLLPGKKESHYDRTINAVVNSRVALLQPEYIICDFEVAIINACRKIFPLTKLSGCLYHLTKNILRRVQHERLFIKYSNDKKFRIAVRSLVALAFVPTNDVYLRFNTLRNSYPNESDERKIMSYFYNNYIGYSYDDVSYPISFWNCYDRFVGNIPRTNNEVEGWHHKINSNLSGSHPSVWTCIEVFKTEQSFWENNVNRIRAGLGESQKVKYRLLDRRLQTIVDSYNTVLDDLDYLKAISDCLYDHLN